MAADLTNLSEEAQSLARVPLFRRLGPQELEKLAEEIDQVNFKDGELIFNQHDRGDSLYVVERGSVRIWVVDEDVNEVTLAELKPGEFFGEMAVTNLLVSQRASRNINVEMEQKSTIGQRIADRVASFGGSWTFIIIYLSFLIAWMAFNTFVLLHYGKGENGAQFDPYPYILLNLMLSMTAALQAPIIMMSQNRAAEKDRMAAEQDFKVNLKSELMLEELIRKQRARDLQIDQLNSALATLETSLKNKQ